MNRPSGKILTDKQFQVLNALAKGLCNKGIGKATGIEPTTVKNHLAAIYRRIGVNGIGNHSRYEAIMKALELGLVECHCPVCESIRASGQTVSEFLNGPKRPDVVTEIPAPNIVWVKAGSLELCRESFTIRVGDRCRILPRVRFDILFFLVKNVGRIYTRDQIITHVWEIGTGIEDRVVDVHVTRIRMALRDLGIEDLIQTIRGTGYTISKFPGSL